MTRLIALLLVLGFAAVPSRAAAFCADVDDLYQKPGGSERRQGERRIKWWLDEKSRLELGITNQQSAEIEQIFQGTLPTLRQVRKELDELESRLSLMIQEGTAPVAAITEQVARVENARAQMNKLRTVMLYRIDRVLSADQRARLKAWHEREGNQRPGGPGRH
jgi:Spy/CpxP family protein refolding chaperone